MTRQGMVEISVEEAQWLATLVERVARENREQGRPTVELSLLASSLRSRAEAVMVRTVASVLLDGRKAS